MFQGLAVKITFSSFAHNYASSQFCVSLNHWTGTTANTYTIDYTNIVSNEKGRNCIDSIGTLTMHFCAVLENEIPVFSGGVYLYNCSVPEDQLKDSSVNTENKGNEIFILGFSFLETNDCVNSYDIVGSLFPSNIHKHIMNTIGKMYGLRKDYVDSEETSKFSIKLIINCFIILCFLPRYTFPLFQF